MMSYFVRFYSGLKCYQFLLVFLLALVSVSSAQVSRSVKFQKSELELKSAKAEDKGEEFQKLKLKDLYNTGEPGKPELPVKYVKLIIPSGMDVSDINITASGKESIQLPKRVYPAQYPIPTSINYTHRVAKADSVIYTSDNPFPSELVKVVDEGYFDGNHIVTLAVYPIQYLPKSNKIVFNSDIDFSLGFKAGKSKPENGGVRLKKNQDLYDNMLASMIDNPEDIMRYQVKPQVSQSNDQMNSLQGANLSIQSTTGVLPFYEYVIITTNDLKSGFDDFVKWKKKKGLNIGVVTIDQILANYTGDLTSGLYDDAGKLRQYLSDAYYSRVTVYALIAGDRDVMPFRYGCGGHDRWNHYIPDLGDPPDDIDKIPADLYFSDFNGNWNTDGDDFTGEDPAYNGDRPDYYPEIFVGRLICQNVAEVSSWVKKVVKYEQNPFNGAYERLKWSLWSQSDEMQHQDQARLVSSPSVSSTFGSFTHTYIEEAPSCSSFTPTYPSGRDIIDELNKGYGFYNMYNHGDAIDILVRCSGEHDMRDIYNAYKYGVEGLDALDAALAPAFCYVTESGNGLDNITKENSSTIIYSIACSVARNDNIGARPYYRSLADVFTTCNESGGPAFLGNTRVGWVNTSYQLHKEFIRALFNSNIYHLGAAELISKANNNIDKHYLAYTHNLFGDPEMPVWTDINNLSAFSSLTVADNGTSITVNTGTTDAEICVSSTNNGANYYLDVRGVGSYTFSTPVRPLYITVTKHNVLPYIAITGGTISGNETWSDQLTVLGNITVASGSSLTIKSGANLTFKNGSSLANNGTLTIAGTATSNVNIVFASSGSGFGGNLIFDGAGASNSSLSNVTMSNANEIRCINGANVKIWNSQMNNFYHGIYIYNSSPDIRYNTITNPNQNAIYGEASALSPVIISNKIAKTNHSGQGVFLLNGTVPYVAYNDISGCDYGVYFAGGAHAYFTDKSLTIYWPNNRFTNNNTALCAAWGGYISGGSTGYNSWYNTIKNNISYEAYAYQSGTILAQYNYWGGVTPRTYKDGNSTLDVSNVLGLDPWEEPDLMSVTTKGNSAASGTTLSKTSATVSETDPVDLLEGVKLEKQGKLGEAISWYKTLVNSEKYHSFALTELMRIKNLYSNGDILSYLEGLSKVKNNSYLHKILGENYLQNGQFDKAMAWFDNAVSSSANENEVLDAKFSKLFAFINVKKDLGKAREILSDIKKGNTSDFYFSSRIEAAENLMGNPSAYSANKGEKQENSGQSLEQNGIVTEYSLTQNYPNPFNPSTVIRYELPSASKVELKVYDILGKEVMMLVNGIQEAGRYNASFNASGLPSGIYIYSFKAMSLENGKNFERNSKMLYLK